MTENTILMLVSLAVIALMAVLIYVASHRRTSTLENTCQIQRDIDQLLAGNRSIERSLAEQRSVLNDAHKKIHAVSKGLEKPAG